MAHPTAHNSVITDSVSQANTLVLGDSPAMSLSNLYLATTQALGNAAHNATTGQQQTNITAQAGTSTGVVQLFSMNTASTARGISSIYGNQVL